MFSLVSVNRQIFITEAEQCEKIDFHLTPAPSSVSASSHSTLLSVFIKYKALLTSADFHIVFPLHTANNKQKTFFY